MAYDSGNHYSCVVLMSEFQPPDIEDTRDDDERIEFHNCPATWCLLYPAECLGLCGRDATPAGLAFLEQEKNGA